MNAFRYQAIEDSGTSVQGVIEAEDRKAALRLLGQRGLFPSSLDACATDGSGGKSAVARPLRFSASQRKGIRRKDITEFTRELSALISAGISIPDALGSLGEEKENQTFREMVVGIADEVRKGAALSTALEAHPKQFGNLYVSMVRVGEEAGALPTVMTDLATLLEHEDEVRGEVAAAFAYPIFVLCFGVLTVTVLLTLVLPRLFGQIEEILPVLPLPTLILLKVSGAFHRYWILILLGAFGIAGGLWRYVRTARGADNWDKLKLRLPFLGPVYLSAALGRFARTLGTLAKAGVSLLPALKIVENTIGNRILAQQIARVAEETRGGDSLAGPLRKLGLFPRAVVQMIDVGEETGKLDAMLLKVAEIQERQMRARTKVLISLLAPALILVVGGIIGFIVLAILVPIFKMSSAIH